MAAVAEDLRRVPLFSGMTDRALGAVAEITSEVSFPAGDALTVEGTEDCAFYLLLDGDVEVTRGGAPVRRMGPGDFLGEISLVDGRPRTATVTAATPVRTLMIERDRFLDLLDRQSAVRHGVMVALADRVRADEQADATRPG